MAQQKKRLTKKRKAELLEQFYEKLREYVTEGKVLNMRQLAKKKSAKIMTTKERELMELVDDIEDYYENNT